MSHQLPCVTNFLSIILMRRVIQREVRMIGYIGEETLAEKLQCCMKIPEAMLIVKTIPDEEEGEVMDQALHWTGVQLLYRRKDRCLLFQYCDMSAFTAIALRSNSRII